ncbi:MAG: hypothetical protein LQ340_001186 [Diploschistes diacapsis]|nr:MAG: hypothetical protein LQ340_001186 [Diploschistes diacapsis]
MSNNNDNIKVELSNGEVQEFDLLVTADGQWSRVRKQCFPPEHVNVVDLGVKKAQLEASKSDRQIQEELFPRYPTDQDVQMVQVVCLKDAAHAPTARIGMGTSLAVNGAYVLVGELSKLGDGEYPSKALEAYESTFRPFVEETREPPLFRPLRIRRRHGRDFFSKPSVWVLSKSLGNSMVGEQVRREQ